MSALLRLLLIMSTLRVLSHGQSESGSGSNYEGGDGGSSSTTDEGSSSNDQGGDGGSGSGSNDQGGDGGSGSNDGGSGSNNQGGDGGSGSNNQGGGSSGGLSGAQVAAVSTARNAATQAFTSFNSTTALASLNNAVTSAGLPQGTTFSSASTSVAGGVNTVSLGMTFTTKDALDAQISSFNGDTAAAKKNQCKVGLASKICGTGAQCDDPSKATYCSHSWKGVLAAARRLLEAEASEVRRLASAAKITFSQRTQTEAQNALSSGIQQQTHQSPSPRAEDKKTGSYAVGFSVVTALALALFQ
jgi:hypothetical protein